jgi:Tfp pilus assembly protein FimT
MKRVFSQRSPVFGRSAARPGFTLTELLAAIASAAIATIAIPAIILFRR